MRINEVIVVEGKNDATRLKQIFDVETIITNGSEISQETLNLIKEVNDTKGVIVFCDPDYPGEKIRSKIIELVPNAKHAYIAKNKAVDNIKHKVGVEHASDKDIIESLKSVVSYQEHSSLSWQEYLLCGFSGNKELRERFCSYLNIGTANTKTLFKRLNMLNLTYDDINKIMEEL